MQDMKTKLQALINLQNPKYHHIALISQATHTPFNTFLLQ